MKLLLQLLKFFGLPMPASYGPPGTITVKHGCSSLSSKIRPIVIAIVLMAKVTEFSVEYTYKKVTFW